MLKNLLIFFFGMLLFGLKASVTAYFNYGVFNVPNGKPFLETYFTVVGSSIRHVPVKGGYQGSVNIGIKIFSGEKLVHDNVYNLLSPVDPDSIRLSGFIDNQRYPLSNGVYRVELKLTDNHDPQKKVVTHNENVVISFSANVLSSSSIQPLESFSKALSPGPLSKSGFDLIPYNVNFFPESISKLKFYFESYGTDSVLGKNKVFLYSYFIERKEDMFRPDGMGAFRKQTSAPVNPLLGEIDISKLESGNYFLVVEIRDAANKLQLEKKWFFQRQSRFQAPLVINSGRSVKDFFGNYNNADSLKMFVECLWPISTNIEKDWAINQSIKKNPELMKNFIVDFWQKRAADSLDPVQLWMNYYKSVVEVNKTFKCGKQKGYYTDRGRVYLQYGKPNQRVMQPSEPNSYPYEIWQYYRLEDKATGQFFSNKKFVFVNKMVADDCYTLIHSDLRGELYNEKWQYEIQQTDNTDRNNIDKTKPNPNFGNNANDFFNNPR